MKERNYEELNYFAHWTRRGFLKQTGLWAGAGLLQPVLSLIGEGKSIAAAYPDEVLSIEKYTKGRVKPGMVISKGNADLVKDLCPEGLYIELTRGREIKIAETTLQPDAFVSKKWIELTLRNKGKAVLTSKGQLLTNDGNPWIGGDPFPEANTALQVMWNHFFNFSRVDDYLVPYYALNVDSNGIVVRRAAGYTAEIALVGRATVAPMPYIPAYKQYLKMNVLTVLEPFDSYGFSIVNKVPYDQSLLPEALAYIPTLRRVRRLPSTQRFESTSPYSTDFISDYGCQNDPLLTWTWALIGRKPMLYPASTNRAIFEKESNKEGFNLPIVEAKFPRSTWELRPDVFIIEGRPQLAGVPYSRKLLYVDAILGRAACADTFDMAGKLWKWMAFLAGPTVEGATNMQALFFADVQRDYRTNYWQPPALGRIKFTVNSGLTVEDWMSERALLQRAIR